MTVGRVGKSLGGVVVSGLALFGGWSNDALRANVCGQWHIPGLVTTVCDTKFKRIPTDDAALLLHRFFATVASPNPKKASEMFTDEAQAKLDTDSLVRWHEGRPGPALYAEVARLDRKSTLNSFLVHVRVYRRVGKIRRASVPGRIVNSRFLVRLVQTDDGPRIVSYIAMGRDADDANTEFPRLLAQVSTPTYRSPDASVISGSSLDYLPAGGLFIGLCRFGENYESTWVRSNQGWIPPKSLTPPDRVHSLQPCIEDPKLLARS